MFIIGWIWIICQNHLLQYTRKWFPGYDSFKRKAADAADCYPDKLPSDAENIQYFYSAGNFDIKTGISFTTSRDNYNQLKETYQLFYTRKEDEHKKEFQQMQEDYRMNRRDCMPEEWKWYEYEEEVTSQFLKAEHLDYLATGLLEQTQKYTVLAYGKESRAGFDFLSGVFYSDEKNEIVIFGYRDAIRRED